MINFDKNFNAEASIKNWANILRGLGFVFMALCGIAAFVVFCCEPEYLWWVSLIILGGGGLILLTTSFSSVMIWGFGEVVGNSKKMVSGSKDAPQLIETELPEL